MGSLLTWGVIISFVMAAWLYVDFGILWGTHTQDEEFEEDHVLHLNSNKYMMH